MKILILRFSSIGDIVLTTPVIRSVKTQLQARVHFASKARFRSLVEGNPYIDRVHVLEDNLWTLVKELRREKFDHVIDLHNNLRTRIIKTLLQVPSHSFNKLNVPKWLMVNFKINRLPARHIVDRYLDTVASLGVRDDGKGLDFFIPATDEVPIDELPVTHHQGYVAYATGGQHATKKLPVHQMIALCERINGPIILLGGSEDKEIAAEVIRHFEGKPPAMGKAVCFNACGKFNLNQSASLLKKAQYVFAHDTGLMHIAAALHKKVFSIWGNTIPDFGMYPYRTENAFLENRGLSCRPCSKIGFRKCPKGHFNCMNGIRFEFELPNLTPFPR